MTADPSGLHSSPRVAIIGAGLAGLATALFLHRLDLSVTIYESRPQDAADGGFLALAPNAAQVLDQLGLFQTLSKKGFAYEEYTFLSSRNCSRIGSTLNGSIDRYGFPALRISRHILRQSLLEAVLKAGIPVLFEHKLTKIDETTSNVSVTFSSGETSTFEYLIGCDGIHSRVRRNMFPKAPEPAFSGQIGIGGGQISRSSVPSSIPQPCLLLGPNNSFMMMPTDSEGSVVNISATIETKERTREQWTELGGNKTQLKEMLVDRHCGSDSVWPEVVRMSCQTADAESLAIWPFYNAPVLDSWISQHARAILIGDAAHAMPPTGGQGAAMAFEDAASLAAVFEELMNSISGHDGAGNNDNFKTHLLAWQSRRQARVTKVKEFTSRGGDMRRATAGRWQQILKEWVMWAFFLIKGPEGGFSWIYSHKEQGPVSEK